MTAVISWPAKVTSTCTGPFSVVTVGPETTVEEESEDPDEEDTEGAGVATWTVDVPAEGS
ncbi:hypothetical protein GCM10022232_72070 [Streptomyces plumbiresistens]|uniref:Uncharacterized protein n=1 Tax=Streptomyces plumbiresistens TaxID=511811 RepID=A0ABP7SY01_9ACTN